jgi:hypothetical protein
VNDQVEPADAARALSEIGRRREQVIRRAAVPRWYWWASAVLTIALAAAVESGSGAVLWAGIALFTAGTLAINGLMLSRRLRGAPLRPGLLAPGSVPRLLAGEAALAAVVIGVGLATVLSLEAAGVPYPRTIAASVMMVVFVAGGQALTRYHTALLVRRSGGQR